MSSDALSPDQFGLPYSSAREQEVGDSLDYEALKPKKISVSGEFRPSQNYLDQETVSKYAERMPRQSDRPKVVMHNGEKVIWTGHHRIAAARKRGQKKMTVDYGEIQ